MSGSNSYVLGASTTATGIAVLPFTGSSKLFTAYSIATITAGTIAVVSFLVTKLVVKR